MGLFLGNLHVLTKNSAGRKATLQALRKLFAEQGYEETPDPERGQMNVAIATTPELRWTSAYCEEWESDPSVLAKTSAELSKKVKAPVLSMVIHDSDALSMGLYEKGKLVDRFTNKTNSDIGDSGGSGGGEPKRWKTILDGSTVPEQLRAIWDAPFTFVDEKLWTLAEILNIPREQLASLANELEELGAHECTRMYFRKPSEVAPTSVRQVYLETIGTIVLCAGKKSESTTVGKLLWNQNTFRNRGSAINGFLLSVDGSAVADGIVSLWRVQAEHFASSAASANHKEHQLMIPPIEYSSDRHTILCKFSEFKLKSADDSKDRSCVAITLHLKGEKEGSGEVRIRMIPNADPSAAKGFEYQISVGPSFNQSN
jgi:hypothetical protein